jgi:hypothetical protein
MYIDDLMIRPMAQRPQGGSFICLRSLEGTYDDPGERQQRRPGA